MVRFVYRRIYTCLFAVISHILNISEFAANLFVVVNVYIIYVNTVCVFTDNYGKVVVYSGICVISAAFCYEFVSKIAVGVSKRHYVKTFTVSVFHIVNAAVRIVTVTESLLFTVVNTVVIIVIPNSPPSVGGRNNTHIGNIIVRIFSIREIPVV